LFYPPRKYKNAFKKIKKRIKERAKLIEELSIKDYREVGDYSIILKNGEFSTFIETEGEKIRGGIIAGTPKFYASDGKSLLKKVESFKNLTNKDLDNMAYIVDMHSHPFTFTPSDEDISFAIKNLEVCPSGLEYIQGIYGYSGSFLLMKISR